MVSIRLPGLRCRSRRLWNDSRGFNLTELLVLVAVIGIITTVSAPAFVSYWRSATLKAGAQELATILNRGRSIAISQNTTLCVKQSVTKVQFLTGGCAGTVWTGPGTDGGGWFTLQNSITVTSRHRPYLARSTRRSEEHTSELQYQIISYAVFCLKKKNNH